MGKEKGIFHHQTEMRNKVLFLHLSVCNYSLTAAHKKIYKQFWRPRCYSLHIQKDAPSKEEEGKVKKKKHLLPIKQE